VYLPIDRQFILFSVMLPSYLFWSSLISNIHLMIDCGKLSTVQVIVAVSFSLTTLSLEILEIVGWSKNSDKLKPHCIMYEYISSTFVFQTLGLQGLQIVVIFLPIHFDCQTVLTSSQIYIIFPHSCICKIIAVILAWRCTSASFRLEHSQNWSNINPVNGIQPSSLHI
jgi:hypothetical protein